MKKARRFWRAFFISLALKLNDFVPNILLVTAKKIELMQGRVIFASEMHIIELIAREAYPGTIPEDGNNFDVLLAYPIFKTPFEKLCFLGKLPKYLDAKGLPLSAMACRYELGYYDKDFRRVDKEIWN